VGNQPSRHFGTTWALLEVCEKSSKVGHCATKQPPCTNALFLALVLVSLSVSMSLRKLLAFGAVKNAARDELLLRGKSLCTGSHTHIEPKCLQECILHVILAQMRCWSHYCWCYCNVYVRGSRCQYILASLVRGEYRCIYLFRRLLSRCSLKNCCLDQEKI